MIGILAAQGEHICNETAELSAVILECAALLADPRLDEDLNQRTRVLLVMRSAVDRMVALADRSQRIVGAPDVPDTRN